MMELSIGCYGLQRRGTQYQLERIREDCLEEVAVLNPKGLLGCRCGERQLRSLEAQKKERDSKLICH